VSMNQQAMSSVLLLRIWPVVEVDLLLEGDAVEVGMCAWIVPEFIRIFLPIAVTAEIFCITMWAPDVIFHSFPRPDARQCGQQPFVPLDNLPRLRWRGGNFEQVNQPLWALFHGLVLQQ